MPLLEYCCCGYTLRCGTITSAVYVVIRRTLGIILSKMHWTKESLGSSLPMLVSVSILSIISSALVLLTFATDISRTRRLILPFIFIEPVYILTLTVALSQAEYMVIPLVLYQICGATEIIIEVCALLCVASYYEECGQKLISEMESSPYGKAVYHIKLTSDDTKPKVTCNHVVKEPAVSSDQTTVEITMPQRDNRTPPPRPPPLPKKLQVHWLTETGDQPDVYQGAQAMERYEAQLSTVRPLTSTSAKTQPIPPPRKKKVYYPVCPIQR